jgi:hypothetical protein
VEEKKKKEEMVEGKDKPAVEEPVNKEEPAAPATNAAPAVVPEVAAAAVPAAPALTPAVAVDVPNAVVEAGKEEAVNKLKEAATGAGMQQLYNF